MLKWRKCPCGQRGCDKFYPSGIGSFYVGSGFRSEEVGVMEEAFLSTEVVKVLEKDPELEQLIERAIEQVKSMSPEEREAMRLEQAKSFARAFGPCEHGVYDWEECPECGRN